MREVYTEPGADWVTITVPRDNAANVDDGVKPVLDSLGCAFDDLGLAKLPKGGTVKRYSVGKVMIYSASGGACTAMRAYRQFDEFIRSFIGESPKVTLLHATLDKLVYAPPVIQQVWLDVREGRIQLSRKRVKAQDCKYYKGVTARGDESGTVYVQKKTARVQCVVYDKQHEIECRGEQDPGPQLRYELHLAKVPGVTLRDVINPAGVFWNYMPTELLPTPANAPRWVPFDEERVLPPSVRREAAARLHNLVWESPDARRMLELAQEVGESGMQLLMSELRQRLKSWSPPGADTPPAKPLAA